MKEAGLARGTRGAHALYRWAKSGVQENPIKRLAVDAHNEYALIDSMVVRTHQQSAGARKKGAKSQPWYAAMVN